MLNRQAIRVKKGSCVDCPPDAPDKPLISGRCQKHYWIFRGKVNASKIKERNKGVVVDPSKRMIHNETQLDGTLQGWFDYWMRFCGFVCEECGAPISRSDADGLHAAQAHILPKGDKMFPSVKTVIHNHLTLGARCGCHSRFDKSWDSAQKMKVWSLAVEKFKWFCHLIAPNEVRKLPEVLRKVYDEIMASRII